MASSSIPSWPAAYGASVRPSWPVLTFFAAVLATQKPGRNDQI
jgi:hypothetical protein